MAYSVWHTLYAILLSDFSEMTLQVCYNSSYGIATVVLRTLTKWHPNDITLKSVCHHSCYGYYDIIVIGKWQTVYAMLHLFFNDITN